jgi:hypothetical protein
MMEAGRELDALVAEKVMGYRLRRAQLEPFTVEQFLDHLRLPWKWAVSPHFSADVFGRVGKIVEYVLRPRCFIERGS